MHMQLKLCAVLLMSSTLGACSMASVNDHFSGGDNYNQQQNGAYHFGASSGCDYTPTPCGNNYTVGQPAQTAGYGQQAPAYGQYQSGQTAYNQSAYGQPVYGQAVPTQPSYVQPGYTQAHNVPAYAAPTAYAGQGLRGPKPAKQSYFYGSLGAVLYDVDSDLYGVQARAGWQSNTVFGVEAEGSLGFTDDDDAAFVDFGAGPQEASFEVDNQVAGFAVARVPVAQQFNLLGRLGYHHTELSAETVVAGVEAETDFSTDGIAYGVGAEYAFSPLTSARVDYTRYDFDGSDFDAVSLAISRKF